MKDTLLVENSNLSSLSFFHSSLFLELRTSHPDACAPSDTSLITCFQ